MRGVIETIRGLVGFVYLVLNLFFWGTPLTLVTLVKIVAPTAAARTAILHLLVWFADRWADGNSLWFRTMLPTKWTITGLPPLGKEGHYLIVANHQSWADIPAIFHVFRDRVPFIRFFLKRELLWVPIVGVATWAMEFPFMKRYSPEYLEKHPEKRGTDLETTRKACERYKTIPVAVLNFLEGTRFSPEKHREQESPYRHLLRPRPGGLSFVLATLGEQLDVTMDVTIAYRGAEPTMWNFVAGKFTEILVDVKVIDVPREFMSAAVTEPTPTRERFKEWLHGLWTAKDAWLDRLRGPEN